MQKVDWESVCCLESVQKDYLIKIVFLEKNLSFPMVGLSCENISIDGNDSSDACLAKKPETIRAHWPARAKQLTSS